LRDELILARVAGKMMPDDGHVNVAEIDDKQTRASAASVKASANLLRQPDLSL